MELSGIQFHELVIRPDFSALQVLRDAEIVASADLSQRLCLKLCLSGDAAVCSTAFTMPTESNSFEFSWLVEKGEQTGIKLMKSSWGTINIEDQKIIVIGIPSEVEIWLEIDLSLRKPLRIMLPRILKQIA